jgi:hypothetical protein
MEDRQWFVLYVLVCLEVGFFLMLVPWSAIWERNYFLEAFPTLRPVLLSPTLKGAVCGLGLANIYLGVTEIFKRLGSSHRTPSTYDDEEHDLADGGTAGASKRESRTTSAIAASEER